MPYFLWVLTIALFVAWLVGIVGYHAMAAWVWLLLAVAIVSLLFSLAGSFGRQRV
ncbi:MAG: lmo0937 family membrane protein [Deltaproteobacteria bacterium]